MTDSPKPSYASWFVERFTDAFARMLTPAPTTRPTVTFTHETPSGLSWFQWRFNTSREAQIWLGTGEESPASRIQLWETADKALTAATLALQDKIQIEIFCIRGDDTAPTQPNSWSIEIKTGDSSHTILLAFSEAALEALNSSPMSNTVLEHSHLPMDILWDVQLPVSISFGQSQLPLKDVIKLTTGSIVELNRTISEPVEVLVNNCVIARGEVVVVEGNFGVRIQHVVSRQDRLRSVGD